MIYAFWAGFFILFLQSPFQPGKFGGYSGSFIDKAVWFLQGKRHISVGRSLTLNPDHNFHLQACDCQASGTWRQQKDTLYLQETTTWFKAGAASGSAGKSCSNSHYRISGNRLFRIKYDGSKTVERLVRQL